MFVIVLCKDINGLVVYLKAIATSMTDLLNVTVSVVPDGDPARLFEGVPQLRYTKGKGRNLDAY